MESDTTTSEAEYDPIDLLMTLIIWREKRFATDPRDQIFGYLGLCDRRDMVHVSQCDYETDPGHVFNAATLDLIISDELLALVLNPRAAPGKGTANIARWGYDLACEVVHTTDDFYSYWADEHYNACKDRDLDEDYLREVARTTNGKFNVLGLKGVSVDKVTVLCEGINSRANTDARPNLAETHANIKKWLAFAQEHIPPRRRTDPLPSEEDIANNVPKGETRHCCRENEFC